MSLDTDSSGSLRFEELKEALNHSGMTDFEMGKLFAEIDFDHDGEINYTEFLVAFASKEITRDAKQLEAVFKHFSDESGFITAESLVESYKRENKTIELSEAIGIISEVEHMKDNKIDFEQFSALMKAVSLKK